MRDGFDFAILDDNGVVLVLECIDRLWIEQPRLAVGLLSIAAEHTRHQIALGRRFFSVLIVDASTPLMGETVDTIQVGGPWRWPMRA